MKKGDDVFEAFKAASLRIDLAFHEVTESVSDLAELAAMVGDRQMVREVATWGVILSTLWEQRDILHAGMMEANEVVMGEGGPGENETTH
jgi:hypothetical protein